MPEPIDRELLLEYALPWIPPQSVLSDTQILALAEGVILKVGDDEKNMAEVLCKLLQAIGFANRALASPAVGGVKRERSHGREVEFFQNTSGALWDDFIDGLVYLCPLLPEGGYNLASTKAHGFYGNVADPVRVPKRSPAYGTKPKYRKGYPPKWLGHDES